MGVIIQVLLPIASLSSVSIYPPTSFHDPSATPIIPNSQNILDSVLKTKSNALFAMPSFLEQWAFSPNAIEILKTLEYVVCHELIITRNYSLFGRSMVAARSRLRWEMPWWTPESSCFQSTAQRNSDPLLISSEMRGRKNCGTGCGLDQTPRLDGLLRTIIHTNAKFWCVSVFILFPGIEHFLADNVNVSGISGESPGR